MLATLGMTVFVFTLVLLLGNVIKEVLQMVIHRQATPWLALRAIALLVPFALSFALPIGMLTAALLVFGRFSAEQELTAARASGISLISLVTPVLLLSVAVSGLCAWLNCDIAPSWRMAYKELIYQAAVNRPANFLQSGESVPFGTNTTIFVGKVHPDGTNLDGVVVSQYDRHGNLQSLKRGTTGTIISDTAHHQIVLSLQNADSFSLSSDGWKPEGSTAEATFAPVNVEPQAQKAVPLPVSDMTFRQLLERRDKIKREMSEPPAKGLSHAQSLEMLTKLKQATSDEITPVMVYLHREAAFSFACIGFTLVGIPLGIRGHRRETSVGVATALVLMLIYYSFVVLGQAWTDHPERAPYLIVWLPNFIFQAVGAVLLWRANRGV
jgi:lipopolysaccharide export system permease protein